MAESLDSIETDSCYNDNYSTEKARDGKINRWDEGEWASAGKGAVYYRNLTDPSGRAWLQLNWREVQNINTIKIYDRPNRFDKILDAWLLVRRGDGTTTDLHLGMFPYGGAPKVINLTPAEGTNVTGIRLTITEVGPDTQNVGVSEIECFRDRSIW